MNGGWEQTRGYYPGEVVTWRWSGDLSGVGDMLAIRLRLFRTKLLAYRV